MLEQFLDLHFLFFSNSVDSYPTLNLYMDSTVDSHHLALHYIFTQKGKRGEPVSRLLSFFCGWGYWLAQVRRKQSSAVDVSLPVYAASASSP